MKAQEIIDILMENPDAEVSVAARIGKDLVIDRIGSVTVGFNTILIQTAGFTTEVAARDPKKPTLEVVK